MKESPVKMYIVKDKVLKEQEKDMEFFNVFEKMKIWFIKIVDLSRDIIDLFYRMQFYFICLNWLINKYHIYDCIYDIINKYNII